MATVVRYPFTRPRLDAEAVPAAGRRVVWDDEVAGLCCRITSTGDRSLWLSKWAAGGQRWVKLGDHPGMSVKEARTRALELLAEIGRGGRPWETRRQLREEASLGELWQHFQTHAAAHKRASSQASDASIWRTVLEPWGAKKQLHAVTRGEVQRLIDRVGKQTPTRANRALALLSAMFNRARSAGLWNGDNPAQGVQRFKEQSRDRFLRPDEIKAMFRSLTHEEEGWRVYFLAAVLCGARRGNLLAMRWQDVELERGLWRVPGEESKNGQPLMIVLPSELQRALTAWRGRCPSREWVFPSAESDTGHKVEPAPAWRRILVRAEAFRLCAVLGQARGWDDGVVDDACLGVLEEAGRMRLLALGRRRRIDDDPLESALAAVQERLRTADIDPGPSMLDVRPHDLRRTLASWAAMTGASLPTIGKALGHRSQATTAIYARLDLDPVREAVETAAGAILTHAGIAGPGKGTP